MTKAPVKRNTRTVRPRATAPLNESRGAGAAAPASVAATAPRGFYNPDSDEGERIASFAHIDETRRQAIPAPDEASADVSAAMAAMGRTAPEPGEDLDSDIARIRSMRRPIGEFSQKLALPKRSGYHTHWFNDEGGRIDAALDAGWAHRKTPDGKPIKRAVGTGRDKGVLFAYAMDIPEVFWLEDMAARHKVAQGMTDGLKANPFPAKAGSTEKSDHGKFYSPNEEAPLSIRKG